MTELWVEHSDGKDIAIRIDWDNDRHHRVEIRGSEPTDIGLALKEAGSLICAEMVHGHI